MDYKNIILIVGAVFTILMALLPVIRSLLNKKKEENIVLGTGSSDRKEIRFMDVVAENRKFHAATDMCLARVVGGSKTTADAVPYQMSLRLLSSGMWFSFCGGSLITYVYVLTAAHCLYFGDGIHIHKLKNNMYELRVVGGADKTRLSKREFSRMQTRKVSSFWRHPLYREFINDVALLEVISRFFPSRTVKPIRLKTPDVKLWSKKCVLSGFGRTSPEIQSRFLKMACMPLVDIKLCRKPFNLMQPESLVCAGTYTKDSCRGDSGGPLACSGYLVGIVSFSNAIPSNPAVFMKVEYYMKRSLILKSGY